MFKVPVGAGVGLGAEVKPDQAAQTKNRHSSGLTLMVHICRPGFRLTFLNVSGVSLLIILLN